MNNGTHRTKTAQSRSSSRSILADIRNHLAGQSVGSTRDQALMEMVLQVLFCRQALRLGLKGLTSPGSPGSNASLLKWYQDCWATLGKNLSGLRRLDSPFLVDEASLAYLDEQLENVDVLNSEDDFVGDLFETFYGSDSRGQEGQFFTPRNAVELLVSMVNPLPGEKIIDPACGAGGFLAAAAQHLSRTGAKSSDIASNLYGVDKDSELASLSQLRLGLQLLETPNITCADSLAWIDMSGSRPPVADLEGSFDVILTNPPFGAKIVAATPSTQKSFELGHKWSWDKQAMSFAMGAPSTSNVPPQVLFIERCVHLLRPGGRMGLVVPESLISSSSYRFVISWLRDHGNVEAVVGMPESLFKTSGKGGTHTKTALVVFTKRAEESSKQKSPRIFMAETKYCGRDSRGRTTDLDDLPEVLSHWKKKSRGLKSEVLGFEIHQADVRDFILAPRYYDPAPQKMLSDLEETHTFVKISELVEQGFLEITTGHEVGASEYGSGPIPFVRTSDISSWEIKIDPKHGVSSELYQSLKDRQDVREGDILMVRDGTYLVGQTALITHHDTKILYQSHLFKIRITDHPMINPYLLLALLSSAPVQRQIQSKKFTQDIIDSLGSRIHELVLPVPRDKKVRTKVSQIVEKSIADRVEARELARKAKLLVAPIACEDMSTE